jgi:GrpB-like predicted nucleotidyltransferase (UPF0157 family)
MRAEVDEPVAVCDYDPLWPSRFEAERERLARSLTGVDAVVEHIGSTAVPGLAAKPVIDILVGVVGPLAGHPVVDRLRALGYEFLGEAGVPGRLYFRRRSGGPAFNVHVVVRDGELWQDNVLLRDYLRTHPDDAREYAAVKRRAAGAAPHSLLRYSELKGDVVGALVERARSASRGELPTII